MTRFGLVFLFLSASALASGPGWVRCLAELDTEVRAGSVVELEERIEAFRLALQNTTDMTRTTRAEAMAQYGERAQGVLSRLNRHERGRVEFALAHAVISLEEFGAEEWMPVKAMSYDYLRGRYIHVSEFSKWTESYVDHKPPHEGFPFEVRLLTALVMRDLTAHNYAPTVMKLHDLKHIHYGVGHARPVTLYFKAARSENVNRYGILVALFEGVDIGKYQAPHEIRITTHFRSLGLNLEESMYLVGQAPREKIEGWMDTLRLRRKFSEIYSSEWRPTYVCGRTEPGESPTAWSAEIGAYVRAMDLYRQDISKARYFHYRRERPRPGDMISTWEDDNTIH